MYNFTLPDYHGNSIINLMSSICHNYGKKHSYPELSKLTSSELKDFRNIILVVVDGLGYEYLSNHKNSFLYKNLKASITSTFLSTTACANTAFSVGYPAQQHALTGWDINMKEVGAVTTILPFVPVYGGESLANSGFKMNSLIDIESMHKDFKANCFTIINNFIANSPFSLFIAKDTEIIASDSILHTFNQTKKIISKKSNKRNYIHIYIPELDSMAHKEGIGSKEVNEIFQEIDTIIGGFAKSLQDTGTKLIVTADHGFVNTQPDQEIWIEEIPGFYECLSTAMSGEQRVRDCFIRPSKVNDFEKIVEKYLSDYCWCFRGEKLISDNIYGLGEPNKKLYDRVGDYVLIMKKNYTLCQKLANYKTPDNYTIGKHGGVTSGEMIVPLIHTDC